MICALKGFDDKRIVMPFLVLDLKKQLIKVVIHLSVSPDLAFLTDGPLLVGKMVRRRDGEMSSQVVTLPHMACSSISLIKQQAEAKMPNCQPHSAARFVCRQAPKLI